MGEINQFSTPFWILRRNPDENGFFQKLEILKEKNPDIFKILHDVCERMCFIDSLVHNLPSLLVDENKNPFKKQKDRLVAYLSLTCIDVVSENKFQSYYDWLSHKIKQNPVNRSNEIEQVINKFCIISDNSEMLKAIRKWLKTTNDEYLGTFGVARNFYQFVKEDLPDWLLDWLFQSYIFVDKDSGGLEWFTPIREDRFKLLTNYFYSTRNKYTHTVEKFSPKEKDYIYDEELLNDDAHNRYYETGTYKPGKKTFIVYVKEDLTESDIIRIIFVYQCRRKYLLLKDDENFLPEYLKRIRYKNLGYLFLKELTNNSQTIEKWGLEYSEFWRKGYPKFNIFELRKRYAENYLPLPHIYLHGWPHEVSYEDDIKTYLESINKINTHLIELEKEKISIDEILKDLAVSDEIVFLYNLINRIKGELGHRLSEIYY